MEINSISSRKNRVGKAQLEFPDALGRTATVSVSVSPCLFGVCECRVRCLEHLLVSVSAARPLDRTIDLRYVDRGVY